MERRVRIMSEYASVTITEAAAIWDVGRQTVSRWLSDGAQLPNGARPDRDPTGSRRTRILIPLAVVRDYRSQQGRA